MAKAIKEINLTMSDGASTTFRVQQLPARKAIKLLHRLARYASPAIARLRGPSLLKADLTQVAIGAAFDAVMQNITDEDMTDLTERMMEGVTVGNVPLSGVFDIVFQGETKNVFKLWKFVLETNFHDFFGDLRTAMSLVPDPVNPSNSPIQSEKNGPSGA